MDQAPLTITTQEKQPKPILKKKLAPEGQKKSGIVWDEENLHETSLERGTRQKIDEPDTPYHYPGDYSVSESVEEEEKAKEKEKEQAPVVNLDDLAKKLEMEKKRQEEGLELVVNPERREEERENFLKKRKLHYAEGLAWKQAKKSNNTITKEDNK